MENVFISYSSNDKAEVSNIVAELKAQGISCWMDLTGIESGEQFEEKIIKAIDQCEVFVFMMSENAEKSYWTKQEVNYAISTNKRVVPVLLRNQVIPSTGWFRWKLGTIDCVDYYNEDRKQKFIENLKSWTPIETLVNNISINKASVSLIAGETESLTAVVSPADATNPKVNWSSSHTSVATVDLNGTVTAVKEGTSTIIATAADGSGVSSNCEVEVSEKVIPIADVSLNKETLSLVVGETETLTVVVSPSDATNPKVNWSSSDTSVATVDLKGMVTAVKEGTSTIIATAADGSGVSTNCEVEVSEKTIFITDVSLNKETLSLTEGETESLSAMVSPADATKPKVNWSSSDTSVATVDLNGIVTAVKEGTSTIIATAADGSDVSSNCVVEVSAPVSEMDGPKGIETSKNWLYVVVGVIAGIAIIFGILKLTNKKLDYPINTYTANGVSFNMMFVKGGTFTMGAASEQSILADDEKPAHEVTLTNDYYIGKTEVTQALWQAVMGSNPSKFKGENLPVECVSWNDCQKFIKKLNELTGKNFRLPTEAEWEFAARGGNNSNHYQYSGSNNLDEVAWYDSNSGSKTHEVGQKSPNELGIFDMSGNVWEWCSDWYGSYISSAQTNPTGPNSGQFRVNRGGSWYINAEYCRSSGRVIGEPGISFGDLGLRLALSE